VERRTEGIPEEGKDTSGPRWYMGSGAVGLEVPNAAKGVLEERQRWEAQLRAFRSSVEDHSRGGAGRGEHEWV
jgi:hypothetical protein